MLLLTPTMLGSLLASRSWLMFWYGVNYVDSIPYLKQYLSPKMILDWIRKSPQTALLITEGVNLLVTGKRIATTRQHRVPLVQAGGAIDSRDSQIRNC